MYKTVVLLKIVFYTESTCKLKLEASYLDYGTSVLDTDIFVCMTA
jgi:hypothetical protein